MLSSATFEDEAGYILPLIKKGEGDDLAPIYIPSPWLFSILFSDDVCFFVQTSVGGSVWEWCPQQRDEDMEAVG